MDLNCRPTHLFAFVAFCPAISHHFLQNNVSLPPSQANQQGMTLKSSMPQHIFMPQTYLLASTYLHASTLQAQMYCLTECNSSPPSAFCLRHYTLHKGGCRIVGPRLEISTF